MSFLSNEATFDEFLDVSFDCLHNIRSEASLLLFDQLSIRFDIETMHNHLRVEIRHVFIAPGKDIYILFYQRCKDILLRWRQTFAYEDELRLLLVTHINLNYFIFCRKATSFKTLFSLKIKLLGPWIGVEWLNVLF